MRRDMSGMVLLREARRVARATRADLRAPQRRLQVGGGARIVLRDELSVRRGSNRAANN